MSEHPTKRFIKLNQNVVWLAAVLGSFSTNLLQAKASTDANSKSKPNVIVVMTDEHNFRTLGCYRETMQDRQAYMWGPSVVETPNIDWLAKNGAMCTSFYATVPVCSPSRGCLVSGMYPQRTGVYQNNNPMRDDIVTFAELLKRQGYATGFAGKWHLDGDGKPQWAPERKFGFEDNRYMFNRGHWKKIELTADGPKITRDKKDRPSYAVNGADENTFTTDFLTDRTIEFIEKNKSNPFCYMLSLPDPHGPDTVRAPYDTMYANQTYEKPTTFDVENPEELPAWGQPDKKTKGWGQSKYYGMVRCIDDNLGRIIAKLKAESILENTIIVFTSDHGDLRSEHHRQNKGVPYEGSTRIPFLVYHAGEIPAETVVDEAMSSVDFCPTLMAMLDIKTDIDFHGRDVSQLLSGSDPENWKDVAIVRATGDKGGWIMVASDRYKLIYSSYDPPWLFDLERDPDEVVNQFEHPGYRETVVELTRELVEYGEKFEEPFMQTKGIQQSVKQVLK